MSKKILSVMLALVLVLSALGTVALAAGVPYEDEESTYSQTWELGTPVQIDDNTWTVEVSLTTDYPTGTIQFVVEETDPSNAIKLEKAEAGSALYYSANISKNSAGKVLIVPKMTAGTNTVKAQAINGVIAKLTYSYTGTGSATIAIKDDAKTADNEGGSLIAVRVPSENLVSTNVVAGQIVNGVGTAQVIGTAPAADPELVPVEGSTGYVDKDRMYVYGVDVGADPLDYFEAVNGYIEMSEGSASATNGTGATLTLYTESGEVFEEYTLIIFGDVSGDGDVTVTDTNGVTQHANGISVLENEVKIFAGDVSADGDITVTDTNGVTQHANGISNLIPNPWAAA